MCKEKTDKQSQDTLAQLVSRGGIYYKVQGGGKEEIMTNVIGSLPVEVLSPAQHKELLQWVMEREALISTGIENGIALPHPRTPLLKDGEEPFVAIAFLARPLEWGTPDNSPVHTVFLIVSQSPKQHLNALTKINFLCMDNDFYNLISARATSEHIIAAVENAEKGWRK